MGRITGGLRIVAVGLLTMGALAPASAQTSPTPAGTGPGRPQDFDVWSSVSAADGTRGDPSPGHTCGIRLDGTLWCWGQNQDGELGLGDTKPRYRPNQVGSAVWTQVDANFSRTCGIQSDDTLWCWGEGLGNVPLQVGQATTWTQVAMSGSTPGAFYCAVQTDTTLWCWGENELGQLGLGDYAPRADPTEVGSGWRSVTVNGATTCAVKTRGSLWCWGDNEFGQLGDDGANYPSSNVPVHVLPGSTWDSVVEGYRYTCGVQTEATLWCWGDNGEGQLGLGDDGSGTSRYLPTQVGRHADWSTATAGLDHTCGVRNGGDLWCWGSNAYGGLGIGLPGGHYDTPVQVGSQPIWDQPSSGGFDTCATQSDHTLWCWGLSDGGELGVGSRTRDTTVPVQVGPPNQGVPVSHRLVSVSADSPTDIWAVGTRQRKQVVTSFVLHGDGSTWSRVRAVNPSKRNTTLTAVDAIAPDDVWAVGSYRVGTTTHPLAEHWDGSSWTKVDAADADAEFSAIDAIAPDDIWAVGHTDAAHAPPDNWVEHWNGTTWTSYDAHSRAWPMQQMTGVAAISHHNVWTVGWGFNDEEAGNLPVTYHWNGSAWRQVLPKHGDRFASYYMRGVDATPAGGLWAAGDWESGFEHESTRIEQHVTNGQWLVVGAPSPGVGSGTYVRSVSTVAVNDVWMVGDYDNGVSTRLLTLHWNGKAWKQVDAPSPGGRSDTTGAAVSADAGRDAWAVGSWNNGTLDQPYIEHWDGTSWTVALKGLPRS